jgi:hypothetical protein
MVTAATWFETRGIAALLTMRVSDLLLRSIAKRCVSKDEATARETVLTAAGFHFRRVIWRR